MPRQSKATVLIRQQKYGTSLRTSVPDIVRQALDLHEKESIVWIIESRSKGFTVKIKKGLYP